MFTFALETFEIECFLIDFPALARCVLNTAQHGEPKIRDEFESRARHLLWWMACRKVLAGLRDARQVGFPKHPKRTAVPTRAEAEAIVCGNDWVRTTVPGLPGRVDAKQLVSDLDEAKKFYEQHLDAGTWMGVFSGKELVEELLSWIWTRGRSDTPLEDLAKAVASEQLRAGRAPAELLELHSVLVARGVANGYSGPAI